MKYWLVKFAPFRYNWQDVLRNGKFEIYAVRNAQARNNLRAMKLGDRVLFYHSQEEKCIKGIMQVIEALHAKWSHPDNEVVKRMAMFKEKSPDILKPILES